MVIHLSPCLACECDFRAPSEPNDLRKKYKQSVVLEVASGTSLSRMLQKHLPFAGFAGEIATGLWGLGVVAI